MGPLHDKELYDLIISLYFSTSSLCLQEITLCKQTSYIHIGCLLAVEYITCIFYFRAFENIQPVIMLQLLEFKLWSIKK